ncbi:helix-turn-helix transcriptional regulator [Streptomyces sp. NBC_01451]|uniref:helix-turn-helix transcriptional regulator n=1 Tax=Streptomyces sp. NBC_01451 TaxID=2903872 RepID=UPI002E380F4A|nr:LuxR C-terminal-related transcriptional regulator [Streptomyces sp. NBC_01451]
MCVSPVVVCSSAVPSVFPGLSVALAGAEGQWPLWGRPDPDGGRDGRVVRVVPPYRELGEPGAVDVVVLRCEDPARALGELTGAMGAVRVPVVVVSPRRDTRTVVEVFRSGAGYLVAEDYCGCMLVAAVVAAAIGHSYLSPAACAALAEGERGASGKGLGDTSPARAGAAAERMRSRLSPRERQIMELLATGLGAQEIGLRLRLSEKTVRNYLSNIYGKLDARGSTDAVLRWLGAAPAPAARTGESVRRR